MKYSDGKNIKLGDKVLIDGKYHGVVVANMDDSEFSEEQPKEKWEYLRSGVMIDTDFEVGIGVRSPFAHEQEIRVRID